MWHYCDKILQGYILAKSSELTTNRYQPFYVYKLSLFEYIVQLPYALLINLQTGLRVFWIWRILLDKFTEVNGSFHSSSWKAFSFSIITLLIFLYQMIRKIIPWLVTPDFNKHMNSNLESTQGNWFYFMSKLADKHWSEMSLLQVKYK